MRPPAIQAERLCDARRVVRQGGASMRPPAIQAERRPAYERGGGGGPARFNEAACNTGGTRHGPPLTLTHTPASMRPPAIQAERGC